LHDEVASKLSLHHRVHGAGVILLVEDLTGRWESIRELTPRTEQVVQANLDTPCIMNPRSLLICALAMAHLGDKDGARRLESGAEAVWMEGYGPTLDYLRVRFAILRGDLQAVERLLADSMAADRLAGDIRFLSARLDALAAMDDADRVEVEAPRLIRPNTYLEAFALRALGLVRRDAGLIETAAARFDGLGLDWHAAQTREWLAGRMGE